MKVGFENFNIILIKFSILTTKAAIAAKSKTKPEAASNLKNHLKGFEIY